jgi:pimeloyl-ACP methyl ester carboxylesterase
MRNRILFAAALALLVIAGVSFAQDDADPASTATTIACPDGIITNFRETEGETVECGTVAVPVNYDEPDGVTIDLVYAILKSRSLAPAPDPVIYLHGGPGSAELSGLTRGVSERFETLRQRRDVVVFDQRSAGYSFGEIDCKAIYDEEYDAAYDAAVEALGPDAPIYAPGFVASQSVYGDCAEALTTDGVDLTQYNTVNNARDVAMLADALGYDTYNLYGISYGTRLGLEVLHQKPDGLRSLIVDSVMPPEIPFNDRMAEANEESFRNIYAMCLADENCAEAYPDLTERLNALFVKLDEEPIMLENGGEINSETLASLLTIQGNSASGVFMVPYFPRLIHELEQDITDTWVALNFTGTLAPQESSDRFTIANEDIPFAASRLLATANDLAGQSDALDESAELVASQALEMIEASSETAGDRFFEMVDERWESPLSAVEELDFQTDYMALPSQEPTVATLETFVNRHFSGADAEILLAQIDMLSDEDVEMLFENARFNDRFHDLANGISHYLYFCNSGVPFNSLEGLRENAETYEIPGLTRLEVEKQALFFEGCDRLPTGSVPESFHEPVTGDGSIPVMVFGGTNDTQTATSWARQAAEDVVESQYVEFPNAGHGVINFSHCAKDIAAAFIDNPEAEVNSSCTADLVPQFVLPDDPLLPLSQ